MPSKRDTALAFAQRDEYAAAWKLLRLKLQKGNSDFAGWHGMSAADIGEVCAAFRAASVYGEHTGEVRP